jgi:hypothetical protein
VIEKKQGDSRRGDGRGDGVDEVGGGDSEEEAERGDFAYMFVNGTWKALAVVCMCAVCWRGKKGGKCWLFNQGGRQ